MAQRPSDTPEQQQIAEAILDVLHKVAGDVVGLSVRELRLQLRARKPDVTDHLIRSVLGQLLDERQGREATFAGTEGKLLL